MNYKQLNSSLRVIVPGLFLLSVLSACNNSDKSGNNSTTDTVADTATTGTTTSSVTPATTATDTSATSTGRTPRKRATKVTIITPAVDRTVTMKADASGYYNYTETAPVFPGGQGSLEDYISNNIEYPQDAIDNNTAGTVYVLFTIDENGKVGNAKTTGAKLGYGLEEEAIRVVNMTGWTPGMNKGKKVKAWYTLPITYRLDD